MPEMKQVVVIETDATRKYPFSRKTLDQIQDLRQVEEDRYQRQGQDVIVPAPVIIANAVDLLHQQTFGE